jgi:hypothetical protein
MKVRSQIYSSVFAVLIFSGATQAQGQGTFQNLNFESAFGLPPTPSGPVLVPTTNAFPGWSVSDVGSPETQVFYNGVSAGSALVTLISANPAGPFYPALNGNYSATLDAGVVGGGYGPASIYQTGTIPNTSRSLTFNVLGDVAALQVSFGGNDFPFLLVNSGPNYNTYGADVSAYAGQTGELRFTENSTAADKFAIAYLDNIAFSPNSIPEPQTWALMFCSAAGWFLTRRRK